MPGRCCPRAMGRGGDCGGMCPKTLWHYDPQMVKWNIWQTAVGLFAPIMPKDGINLPKRPELLWCLRRDTEECFPALFFKFLEVFFSQPDFVCGTVFDPSLLWRLRSLTLCSGAISVHSLARLIGPAMFCHPATDFLKIERKKSTKMLFWTLIAVHNVPKNAKKAFFSKMLFFYLLFVAYHF